MKVVSSAEARARWAALLTEVQETGASITITSHGRPIAVLSRIRAVERKFGQLPMLSVPDTFNDALSEAELQSQVSRGESGVQIVRRPESLGTANGQVLDWSKRGGHSLNPKLHWNCPQCGQEWWEDFVGDVENPYLAGSGCNCVDLWHVHWDPSQAADELTSQSTESPR